MNRWTVDINDWKKANIDVVKYALEEGKIRLLHTVELAERISTRGLYILSLLIPVIGLFVWSVYNKHTETSISKTIDISVLQLLIVFGPVVVLCIFCVILIFPRSRVAKGKPPSNLLVSQVINFEDNQAYLALLIGECENIDEAIKINTKSNNQRLKILKLLIIGFLAWFLSMTIAILLVIEW